MSAQKKENPEEEKKSIFAERLFEPDEDPATFRKQMIELSDSFGKEEHFKKFTEEETQRFKNMVVDNSQEIKAQEEELAEFSKQVKEVINPLKKHNKKLLEELKAKGRHVEEELFQIMDSESRTIGVYDEYGVLQYIKQMKRGEGLQKMLPLISND